MKKIIGIINAAGLLAVFGFMAYFMGHFSDYVYKFGQLSFFNEGWDYFVSVADRPGFLLLYAGRFLTQFCMYPSIAIGILMLIFAGIVAVSCKVLIKNWNFAALSVVAPLLAFLFITSLGYEIYTVRADAQIFTQPLGLLVSVLGLWAMVSCKTLKPIVPLAFSVVAFPLFGFYALLSLLCYAFYCITHYQGLARLLLPLEAIICAAAIPFAEYLLFFDHTPLDYLWFEGTPYLDYGAYHKPLYLLTSSAASLLLLSLIPFKDKKAGWKSLIISIPVVSLAIISIYLFPDRSLLLHRQLQTERQMEQGNWDKTLSLTASLDITNDPLVSYRNCALYAKGKLAEECYIYSFKTVPVLSGNNNYNSSRIAGPSIFFYSGLLNYSARWCSELNLYGSYSLERLKYLAKIALFNGEKELALKYIDSIGRSTLNKEWASRYRKMANNPSLLEDDSEYKLLKPLQAHDEKEWYPSDVASYNVLVFYSFVKGKSIEMLDWNMAAALLTKSGEFFNQVYPEYSALRAEMPEGLKNAADFFNTLIYSGKEPDNKRNYKNFFYNETILRPN